MGEQSGKTDAAKVKPRAGFWATVSAVLGAFIGIRKRSAYERDAAQFQAKHLIIAGIIGGVIFVVSIALIARFVVSQSMH